MSMSRVIDERVYIGDNAVAQDIGLLIKMNITHVLNVTSETPISSEHQTYFTCKQIKIKNAANVNIRSKLFTAVSFICKALEIDTESLVLVHCDSGDVRSAAIVVAFLMKKK